MYSRLFRFASMRLVVSASIVSACVGEKFFDLSKPTEGVVGHFEFTLNGQYKLGLDTGGDATWMTVDTMAHGGYHVSQDKRVSRIHKRLLHPYMGVLDTEFAVAEVMNVGKGVEWQELVPLVDTVDARTYGSGIGMLGASPVSVFAKAHPVVTIVPHKDFYRIHADENISFPQGKCAVLPISQRGFRNGRWMVSDVTMRLSTGHYTYLDFEINTGYPHLALPEPMWKPFHEAMLSQGARELHSPAKGVRKYSNCYANRIPSISYGFKTQDLEFKIPASSFGTFSSQEATCELHIVVHDAGKFGGNAISFIGVPVLRSVVTQLNRKTNTVSFCP